VKDAIMIRIAALLLFTLLAAAPARAQDPPKPPTAAAQDEFVPVSGPINANDTMPAPVLVGTAYAFIWIVLFAYLWSIRSRLATVEREMAALARRVSPGSK
jgi:CcmD family protein